MIPRDAYNGSEHDPHLHSEDYNDVYQDFTSSQMDGCLPLISTMGQGPRGIGLKATIAKETEDAFSFRILDELDKPIYDSPNLHAGKINVSNITEETFDLSVYRDAKCVDKYTLTMPKGDRGSCVFSTTGDAYPFQETGIYQIPKADIAPDEVEPDIRDIIMFTAQEAITSNTDYHTWLCIGDIRLVSSTFYTVNCNIKFKIFDAHGYAPVSYVDKQDNKVREEFAAEDARIEQDYKDADEFLKVDYRGRIDAEKTARIDADAAVALAAAQDATAKANQALADAKAYTGDRETEIRRDFVSADNEILRQAKEYTDDKIVGVLSDAKAYTDTECGKLDTKISGKLDKKTDSMTVYGTDNANHQIMIPYTSGNEADSIPMRDHDGNIKAGIAKADHDVVIKLMLDEAVEGFVKQTTDNVDIVYAHFSGAEHVVDLAKWAKANSIAWRDVDKTLSVGDPVNDDDAATKKYVDEHGGDGKVDKVSTPTIAYITDSTGSQTTKKFGYTIGSGTLMTRDNAGRTHVTAGTESTHAVNKSQLDTSITDLTTHVDEEDALLQDQIDDLKARGRYLSTWDATIGKPTTDPTTLPYPYKSGDYYIVSKVSDTTNYKPDGSSYTGAASTVTETSEVWVNDTYYYDGTKWGLISQGQKTVAFSSIVGDPYDNTNLKNALDLKANDNAVVHLTGDETIEGNKYFNADILTTGSLNIDRGGSSYVKYGANSVMEFVPEVRYGDGQDVSCVVNFPNASGTLALTDDVDAKADDDSVVHLTGNETIVGNKTFNKDVKTVGSFYVAKGGSEFVKYGSNNMINQIPEVTYGDGTNTNVVNFPNKSGTIALDSDVETRLEQVATMPAASVELKDKIIQYIGTTTSDYTNGFMYKCIEDAGTYKWEVVNVAGELSNYVKKTGDTMSGPLNMGLKRITNLGTAMMDTDAIRKIDVTNMLKDYVPHYKSLLEVSDNEGIIAQYIGSTTDKYTKGHFYICVNESGSYKWNPINVQDGAKLVYVQTLPTTGEDDTIYGKYASPIARYSPTMFEHELKEGGLYDGETLLASYDDITNDWDTWSVWFYEDTNGNLVRWTNSEGKIIASYYPTTTYPVSGFYIYKNGWNSIGGGGNVLVDDVTIEKNSSNELQVKSLGITTEKLANNAVTTAKIANGSVTDEKISSTTLLKKDDVVNNLTAGGTTVPLSAEQGKVLQTNKANQVDLSNEISRATAAESDLHDYCEILEDTKLSLSGGTMTGAIELLSSDVGLKAKNDEGWSSMAGGSNRWGGSFIRLYGKNFNEAKGIAELTAYDGDKLNSFILYPNGSATINDSAVLTESSADNKYLKLTGGNVTGSTRFGKTDNYNVFIDNVDNTRSDVCFINNGTQYSCLRIIKDGTSQFAVKTTDGANWWNGPGFYFHKTGDMSLHSTNSTGDTRYDLVLGSDATLKWNGSYIPTLQQVYDLIHPVNEIVFGFQAPSTAGVTATWTDISSSYEGRYFKVSSTQAVGTSEAEQLPNIKGGLTTQNETPSNWAGTSGALSVATGENDGYTGHSANNRARATINFNAHDSNSVYTDSGKVRPLTTTIKVWKRTA